MQETSFYIFQIQRFLRRSIMQRDILCFVTGRESVSKYTVLGSV